MARLTPDAVVAAALASLDGEGLDRTGARRLAKVLGTEQPVLCWHFPIEAEPLAAMAEAAMLSHADVALPVVGSDRREWFTGNMRGFRTTLRRRRNGACLHAGSHHGPGDRVRIEAKIAFPVVAGVNERDARMAMPAASRYMVGGVPEKQADAAAGAAMAPLVDHDAAFEVRARLDRAWHRDDV